MSSKDHTAAHRLANLSGQMAQTLRFMEIPMAPPDAILGMRISRQLLTWQV